jgi:hypothetical protein
MQVSGFVTDLAKRAGHTFWQAFLAALGVLWASSGLHVGDLVHVSTLHKLAIGVIAAAGAAALSTVKTLIIGARSSATLAALGTVPAIEPPTPVVVVPAEVSAPVTPADPAQPAAGVPPAAAAAPAA